MKLEVGHVTICSVEPKEFEHYDIMTAPTEQEPNMNGRRTRFYLPAMDKKKGWSVVKIYDGVRYPALYEIGQGADKPATRPIPIPAMDTANKLVKEWQETTLKLKFPRGIMIIKGDMPDADELKILNEMSTQRMRAMVQNVDLAVNAGNNLDFVTKEYIDAANALGEVREWARADRRQKKICPRCQGIVEAGALGCIHCGIDFGTYYEEDGYSLEEVKVMDPDVHAAMAAKKARLAKRAGATKG
jgi:hypothetical protein